MWTNPPELEPSLTVVLEVKSGLSFEILAGPRIRPLQHEFEVRKDPDGLPNLVKVRQLSPTVERWIAELPPDALISLELKAGEVLSVHKESVAIQCRAEGLQHLADRTRMLIDFAKLLPKLKTHSLPRQLRPISDLIRSWSISDDRRREDRVTGASRPALEALVAAWRRHLDLINSTIAERPESALSGRLMAFSEAAMEAEQMLNIARG